MSFTDHMQRNRFELKYIIDERRARGVRDFLKQYMVRDPNARAELQWAYPIYSIYLDSPQLDLYGATVCGHKNRFKLRARYYDGKVTSPVFFEIKRRVNDVIFKDRAGIRRQSVKRLLRGAVPTRDDLIDPGNPEAFAALKEFCRLATSLGATGRAIVAYTREAYNSPENDDVRVTFDRKVAGSWYDDSLPIEAALRTDRAWVYPEIEPGQVEPGVVLELKFTGCYPRWMESLAASFDLYRTCMAKYVASVEALGPAEHGIRRERWVSGQRRESLV